MKLIGRFKSFLHENSILYLKFLKYSLIHADRIRFYFNQAKITFVVFCQG